MKLKLLCTAILVAIVAFIFANSAQPAAVSDGRSLAIVDWLNAVGLPVTNHIIRKLAHFCEYALFGFWLLLTLRRYTPNTRKVAVWLLAAGLLVPVADELIQRFTPGRSCQLSDVLLDCSGVAAGCLAFLALISIAASVKKRKLRSQQ